MILGVGRGARRLATLGAVRELAARDARSGIAMVSVEVGRIKSYRDEGLDGDIQHIVVGMINVLVICDK